MLHDTYMYIHYNSLNCMQACLHDIRIYMHDESSMHFVAVYTYACMCCYRVPRVINSSHGLVDKRSPYSFNCNSNLQMYDIYRYVYVYTLHNSLKVHKHDKVINDKLKSININIIA